jgi:hypothetical protein
MKNDLKDILSHLNKDIDQEKLLEYIRDNLSPEAQHELEKQMSDDAFINDAVEGLQELKNKKDLPSLIHELNHGLKKQIEKQSKRKEKRKPQNLIWIYVSIIIILLLIVLTFVVIKRLSE